MAKTGFEYVVIGKLSDPEAASGAEAAYTAGMYLGPASTFNVSPNVSDVTDYGDDRAVEVDNTVTGGTVSVELNERTVDAYVSLLGHTKTEADENNPAKVVVNANDTAPYLGIGAVGKSVKNKKKQYTVKFYYKTSYKEPNDEHATKQESTSFTHTTIEGKLFPLGNGDWKEEAYFDKLEDAKAFLNKKVGITA